MNRVMVVGQPGSGKSTLARALGAKTGAPAAVAAHHLTSPRAVRAYLASV
jgi:adenylate kinase family enzyme